MKRLVAAIITLFVCAGLATAQEVKLPPTIKALPGQWVIVAPESIDGGLPRWRSSQGLSEVDLSALFPPDLLKQARGRVFAATRPGTYVVEAWNAKGDVASAISRCVITVIGTPSDPMPDPKPGDPPKDPPAVPTGKLYFLVVRPDGPAHPRLVELLGLPAWGTLAAAGHTYRDATISEARSIGATIPTGQTLPCVVVLRPRAGDLPHEQMKIVAMPETADAVLALPKAVTQ